MNRRFPKGIQLHKEKGDFAAADDILLSVQSPHTAQSWVSAKVASSLRTVE